MFCTNSTIQFILIISYSFFSLFTLVRLPLFKGEMESEGERNVLFWVRPLERDVHENV